MYVYIYCDDYVTPSCIRYPLFRVVHNAMAGSTDLFPYPSLLDYAYTACPRANRVSPGVNLTFTRYCRCPNCMVYGIRRQSRGRVV